MRRTRRSLMERFLSWVLPEPNSGCWLWNGSGRGPYYGKFAIKKNSFMAHRVSYELFKGKIPDGLEIDHVCRNRICVNPDHLEPVTRKENHARSIAAGAHSSLVGKNKTHCPHGHEYTRENTYIDQSGWRECRACNRDRARNRRVPALTP